MRRFLESPREYNPCSPACRPSRFKLTLVDATWISVNTVVYIKRIPTDSEEPGIALLLGSDSRQVHEENYCVPVVDQDTEDSAFPYMPSTTLHLREWTTLWTSLTKYLRLVRNS